MLQIIYSMLMERGKPRVCGGSGPPAVTGCHWHTPTTRPTDSRAPQTLVMSIEMGEPVLDGLATAFGVQRLEEAQEDITSATQVEGGFG